MKTSWSKGIVIFSPLLLVGSGVFWAWFWSGIYHVVPYFYLIAPFVDIAAFAIVGSWVHRRLQSLDAPDSLLLVFGVLAMVLFYSGNRFIWFSWLAPVWPFGSLFTAWFPVVWEVLVILAGLTAVTGLLGRLSNELQACKVASSISDNPRS